MPIRTSVANIKILKAEPDDLPAIQEIASIIWHEHYPSIITQRQIVYMLALDYSLEAMNKDLVAGISMDMLIVGETLAGFAAYGPTGHEEVIKLHKLYLLQSFHGQGLGSMFLAHIEHECIEQGFKSIVLNVNKNNHSAIKTYRRNGYINQESVLADIGGGFFMDDYVMAKDL